jgi:O-antigen/teichoic acid export membrane protein
LYDRLYSALRSHAIAKIVTQAVSWAGTIFVVRLLDTTEFGLYGIASIILSYASLIYDGSVTEALVQRTPADLAERRAVFTVLCLVGAAAVLVLAALAVPLGDLLNEPAVAPIVVVMSLALLCTSLGAMPQARLMREMRFDRLAVISSIQAVVTTVLTVWLAWRGAGAWSLAVGFVVGTALRTLMLIRAAPDTMRPTRHLAPAMGYLRFGGVLFADNLLWRWYTSVDTFFLARWSGTAAVGYYTLGRELANMPVEKVSTVVNDVSLPAFAHIAGDRVAAARLLNETIRMHATLGFPLFWGLAAVAHLAVPVLFGERWQPAVFPLVALCLIAPLRLIGSIETPAITGIGRPWILVKTKLVIAPVMTVALAIGAWYGGIDGAAIAWLVAFPLAYAVAFRYILDAVGLTYAEMCAVMRGPALAAGAMGAAVYGWAYVLGQAGLPRVVNLVSAIALGMAVFAVCLRLVDATSFGLAWARFGRVLGVKAAG